RTRLLVVNHALRLHHTADLDGTDRIEATVGISEKIDLVAERLADFRDDRLGPPRPFVDIAPDLGTDAKLERVEAELALQAAEALGFGLGRDVALHRRGVGAERHRPAAEQFRHRPARLLAPQVPDRGVDTTHGAAQM